MCVNLASTTYFVRTSYQLRFPSTGRIFLDERFPYAAQQKKMHKKLSICWYQEINEKTDKN
jgi:hypothetical protein